MTEQWQNTASVWLGELRAVLMHSRGEVRPALLGYKITNKQPSLSPADRCNRYRGVWVQLIAVVLSSGFSQVQDHSLTPALEGGVGEGELLLKFFKAGRTTQHMKA